VYRYECQSINNEQIKRVRPETYRFRDGVSIRAARASGRWKRSFAFDLVCDSLSLVDGVRKVRFRLYK
jgi:hypothetical protein